MKITSVMFIKPDALPKAARNTELTQIVQDIITELKRMPAGQALSFTSKDAKKYSRYALQKRLQKAGHKVSVRSTGNDKDGYTFYVVRA